MPVLCAGGRVLIGIPAPPCDIARDPDGRCPDDVDARVRARRGAYACKVLGLVVIGSRPLPAVIERCLALVPAALISALDRPGHVLDGQELVLDARPPGVAAAAFAAWRRAPLVVVIISVRRGRAADSSDFGRRA